MSLSGKANTKQLGTIGENIACRYLEEKGYRIRERNFSVDRGPIKGEIDIIAEKEEKIVFVEVKAAIINSSLDILFGPEDRVNPAKQRKIRRMAEIWLDKNNISLALPWQIDVISIKINQKTKKAKIRYFENIASA